MNYKITVLFFLLSYQAIFAEFKFRNQNATLKVSSNATLILESAITNFNGTLAHDNDQSIQGEKITFQRGILKKLGNQINIDAQLDPSLNDNVVQLTGDKSFKGVIGSSPNNILVSGKNNRLEGQFLLGNDIILQDANSSLTCAFGRRVNKKITLNGGTLFLEDDLNFVDGVAPTGPGIISFNKRKLILGASPLVFDQPLTFKDGNDLVLNSNLTLETRLTLTGSNTINGNNNILIFGLGGEIVITPDASITFKNITLQNVSGSNIRCSDNSGKIIFQNVLWMQDDNYTLSNGAFEVFGLFDCLGSYTFVYQTLMTSTIKANATMIVDSQLTFSYDPLDSRKNHIEFEDATATLMLSSATLHATRNGLQLETGKLIIDGDSIFKSEFTLDDGERLEEGITFGSGTALQDLFFDIAPGAILSVNQGYLLYNNALSQSFKVRNANSTLRINSGAILKLNQPLMVGDGQLSFSPTALFLQAEGAVLTGPASIVNW